MPERRPTPILARHARVRRNNADDAQRMRDQLMGAALRLYLHGGLEAVSMRAVAAEVGVSAMAPYRYFDDKADLLNGLWQHVLWDLYRHVTAAASKQRTAADRERAANAALLDFWESHPEQLRLVQATQGASQPREGVVPAYRELIEFLTAISEAFAAELGAGTEHVALAGDVRIAMWMGYTSALLNRRYPWGDRARLRKAIVERMVGAVADTLRHGEGAGPARAPARKAVRGGPRRRPSSPRA
ncbi:MAG TPA: TetR/AcrR family transcriptional regulator [Caldimonas sp.]|nr:TetR/AcrR family transcriptional regulator [Caldimonas sp.]